MNTEGVGRDQMMLGRDYVMRKMLDVWAKSYEGSREIVTQLYIELGKRSDRDSQERLSG